MNMKKNDFQQYRQAVIGFCAGVVITLVIFAAAKGVVFSGEGSGSGRVVAEIAGEKLTEGKLQEMLGASLIPLETDRYAVYSRVVDKWINEKLFAKEAKALGISLQDLYFKKIWEQVRVSSGDVSEYYNNNKELYNQPLEKIREPLLKQLREKEYSRIEQKYLDELKAKYRAKVLLEKPKYYANDLAVIPQPGAPMPAPGAPAAAPQPGMPPAAPRKISYTPADLKGQQSQGPENAQVTILEFSDFHCPFCGRVSPTMNDIMKNYAGKVRRLWFHYPLPFHQGADQTAAASECAGDQGKFWEYHDKLFEKPGQFKDDAALIGVAKDLGLKEDQFKDCLSSGKYKEKVKNNAAKGQAWGVKGTPAFFINGVMLSGAQPYEMFKNAVDNAINPGSAPMPAAPAQRAPEPPKFVNFSESDLAGKPTQGPANAPVTIVEFSDFHCPFCGRGSQTMDQVVKNYSGKIRRVFRHFPLPMHQGAEQTHAASECAGEQGKFWEYHGKLFEKPGQFKGDDALIGLAKELDLNEKKFKSCLDEGKYKEKIKKEVEAGQNAGVSGTPTFFINGQLISGAMPYESFSKMVDDALAKKK